MSEEREQSVDKEKLENKNNGKRKNEETVENENNAVTVEASKNKKAKKQKSKAESPKAESSKAESSKSEEKQDTAPKRKREDSNKEEESNEKDLVAEKKESQKKRKAAASKKPKTWDEVSTLIKELASDDSVNALRTTLEKLKFYNYDSDIVPLFRKVFEKAVSNNQREVAEIILEFTMNIPMFRTKKNKYSAEKIRIRGSVDKASADDSVSLEQYVVRSQKNLVLGKKRADDILTNSAFLDKDAALLSSFQEFLNKEFAKQSSLIQGLNAKDPAVEETLQNRAESPEAKEEKRASVEKKMEREKEREILPPKNPDISNVILDLSLTGNNLRIAQEDAQKIEPSEQAKKLVKILQEATQAVSQSQNKKIYSLMVSEHFKPTINVEQLAESFTNNMQSGLLTHSLLYSTNASSSPEDSNLFIPTFLRLPESKVIQNQNSANTQPVENKSSATPESSRPSISLTPSRQASNTTILNFLKTSSARSETAKPTATPVATLPNSNYVHTPNMAVIQNVSKKPSVVPTTRSISNLEQKLPASNYVSTLNLATTPSIANKISAPLSAKEKNITPAQLQFQSKSKEKKKTEVGENHRFQAESLEKTLAFSNENFIKLLQGYKKETPEISLDSIFAATSEQLKAVYIQEQLLIMGIFNKIKETKQKLQENRKFKKLHDPEGTAAYFKAGPMKNPVTVLGSMKIYEKEGIEEHFKYTLMHTCPITNISLLLPEQRQLIPMPKLAKAIEVWAAFKKQTLGLNTPALEETATAEKAEQKVEAETEKNSKREKITGQSNIDSSPVDNSDNEREHPSNPFRFRFASELPARIKTHKLLDTESINSEGESYTSAAPKVTINLTEQ